MTPQALALALVAAAAPAFAASIAPGQCPSSSEVNASFFRNPKEDGDQSEAGAKRMLASILKCGAKAADVGGSFSYGPANSASEALRDHYREFLANEDAKKQQDPNYLRAGLSKDLMEGQAAFFSKLNALPANKYGVAVRADDLPGLKDELGAITGSLFKGDQKLMKEMEELYFPTIDAFRAQKMLQSAGLGAPQAREAVAAAEINKQQGVTAAEMARQLQGDMRTADGFVGNPDAVKISDRALKSVDTDWNQSRDQRMRSMMTGVDGAYVPPPSAGTSGGSASGYCGYVPSFAAGYAGCKR